MTKYSSLKQNAQGSTKYSSLNKILKSRSSVNAETRLQKNTPTLLNCRPRISAESGLEGMGGGWFQLRYNTQKVGIKFRTDFLQLKGITLYETGGLLEISRSRRNLSMYACISMYRLPVPFCRWMKIQIKIKVRRRFCTLSVFEEIVYILFRGNCLFMRFRGNRLVSVFEEIGYVQTFFFFFFGVRVILLVVCTYGIYAEV